MLLATIFMFSGLTIFGQKLKSGDIKILKGQTLITFSLIIQKLLLENSPARKNISAMVLKKETRKKPAAVTNGQKNGEATGRINFSLHLSMNSMTLFRLMM